MLKFNNRRGRPKVNKPKIDKGTPELALRKERGELQESIDLCLRYGLINADYHRAALHFRWLYTVRYGVPTVKSVSWDRGEFSVSPKHDNPAWRKKREREYINSSNILKRHRVYNIIVNCVIHDYIPLCFKELFKNSDSIKNMRLEELSLRARKEVQDIRKGLRIIA